MNTLILAAVITANLAEPVSEPSFPDGAEARQELLWQDYTNRQWQVYRNKVRAAESRKKAAAAEAKRNDPIEVEKRKLAELKRKAEREQRERAWKLKQKDREEFLKALREKCEASRANGGAK